jgi:hypothetical protein
MMSMTKCGTRVAPIGDIRDIHQGDRGLTVPRGLVGTIVETFSGSIVVVEFDLAQGIPGAAYAKPRRIRTYVDNLVEIR